MAEKTLTSATCIYMLTIPGLFNAPIQLQEFATDDIFSTNPLRKAQVQMGVDGKLSGGYVFVEVPQRIMLQADSKSMFVFDQWAAAQDSGIEALVANGIASLPAVQTKWAMTRGFLTEYTPTPGVKKTLQPRTFEITWEKVQSAPT